MVEMVTLRSGLVYIFLLFSPNANPKLKNMTREQYALERAKETGESPVTLYYLLQPFDVHWVEPARDTDGGWCLSDLENDRQHGPFYYEDHAYDYAVQLRS